MKKRYEYAAVFFGMAGIGLIILIMALITNLK
jgi:hypothetical protein